MEYLAVASEAEVTAGWGGGPGPRLMSSGGKDKDKEYIPITKLGHLVKDMKIKSLEEICLFSVPIKESQIIDFFLGASLTDEVLKIYAGVKTDSYWPEDLVQGICHNWGLQ